MADENEDQSQKTEDPTRRRIEEAEKKGQVTTSREVNNFFMLLGLALMVAWLTPWFMGGMEKALRHFIEDPHLYSVDEGNLQRELGSLFADIALVFLPILGLFVVMALAGGLIQHKLVLSLEPLKPKLEKISPLKGLKRLFSMRAIVEFIKGLLKITIVGVISVWVVMPDMGRVEMLPNYAPFESFKFVGSEAIVMLTWVCAVMFLIAIMDYMYQHYEYIKSLRMSKRDIKEEYKMQEGDPLIKQRLRNLRMQRARQRIATAVPQSDVVITNPTHFAIALDYNADSMAAPKVTAKGQDHMAMAIRRIAEAHDIPIVENKPLARGLYDAVEVDQEIPTEFYQAVAEVIGYVYRLRGEMPSQKRGKDEDGGKP